MMEYIDIVLSALCALYTIKITPVDPALPSAQGDPGPEGPPGPEDFERFPPEYLPPKGYKVKNHKNLKEPHQKFFGGVVLTLF